MLKNIKVHCLFFLLAATLFSACYKDKGNYDYTPINELSITLDSNYVATYGEKLFIKPVIKLTKDVEANTYDTTKYSYEWSSYDYSALYANQRVVLARTRDLDTTITIPPGSNYEIYYRITDKRTGVQWQATAKLTVNTAIYEGWMALCDVNGQLRVDMASYANGGYTMIPDVLGFVNSGLNLTGQPLDIAYAAQASLLSSTLMATVYISTTTGTNRIDPESFKWDQTMNIQSDMLASVPSNFGAQIIATGLSYINYMLDRDGNLYYFNRVQNMRWGTTVNVVTGEAVPFKCAPFLAKFRDSNVPAIVYDIDKKRFIRHNYATQVCTVMPTNEPFFPYTTGMDLVYMEAVSGYSGGELFAVLHDTGSGKYYLARVSCTYAAVNQTYFQEIPLATATDFDKAEHFAVNPDYGYLFYNVGGKVYEYDFGLKQSFLMVDKGTSKISALKFQHFLGANYISGSAGKQILYNKLIVANYDPAAPATSCGALDFYTVPQVNGQLTLFQSLTGFGKVQSLTYRER